MREIAKMHFVKVSALNRLNLLGYEELFLI